MQWLAECCVQEKAAETLSSKLFASWKSVRREPDNERIGTQKALSELLQAKFKGKHTRLGKVFYGVRVRLLSEV